MNSQASFELYFPRSEFSIADLVAIADHVTRVNQEPGISIEKANHNRFYFYSVMSVIYRRLQMAGVVLKTDDAFLSDVVGRLSNEVSDIEIKSSRFVLRMRVTDEAVSGTVDFNQEE